MCWTTNDAKLDLWSRKSTLARIWRSKAEIFTLYLWNLYITVCQSYLSYTSQFHSISSTANHSKCPSRSFAVVRFTRSGVMDMHASKSCYAEEKFCGIGDSVIPDTKNENGRFAFFAEREFSFKEDVKDLRYAVLIS